jgi:hypothetical protein
VGGLFRWAWLLSLAQILGDLGLRYAIHFGEGNSQFRHAAVDAQEFAPGEEDPMQKGNSALTPITLFNLTRLQHDKEILTLFLSLTE